MTLTASTAAGIAALLVLTPGLAAAQTLRAADTPLTLAQLAPPPLPAPPLAPPPLPLPPAALFFYSDNGKPVGPVPLSEIQAKIASGAIKPDTLVWKSGTPNWVAAKELPEIAKLLPAEMDPKAYFVGTWETDAPGPPSTTGLAKLTITAAADGTLKGTYAVTLAASGASVVIPVSGTWSVEKSGDKRFTLAISLQLQDEGQTKNVSTTSHVEVIDANTLRDVDNGVISKRIAQAPQPAPVAPTPAPAPSAPTPAAAPAPVVSPRPAPAPVASGCTGKNVLLSDDFRQVDDSWGTDPNTDAVTVEDGKVKFKPAVNGGYTILYGGSLFDDADMCVTLQTPHVMDKPDSLAAGPVFWAEDYNNYYVFDVSPIGTAAILRRLKGKWVTVINYRKADGLKTEPGGKNLIRITTSGNAVTAYINGVKFASVKGQAPAGGGQVGLHAESEAAHRDTWKFSDLKLTDLP